MSTFGDFFSPSQETQGTTSTTQTSNSNSTSQGNTQNNLWPQLQPYFQGYANTAFNPNAFNANQTNAAARQDAVTGNLIPAFSAASNIASNGFASQIPAFNNPYNEQVIANLQSDFKRQNAEASDADSAMRAKNLSLGNRTGAEALVSRGAQDAQAKALVAALQQGFNTSAGLAAQDAGLRLQGAGTTGNLTGAATGANQAGFNIGQTLWQNPLSWVTQGASSINPFLQGAGQSTSGSQSGTSTGSSTGFNTGYSQTNPSTFQQIAGIAGLGASLFSDERVKDNIAPIGETFDGQPIYRFNYKGQPETQIGLIAQDVERSNPDAVGSVGGVKTVDYDAATARAAGKGHFADGGGVGAIQPYHSNIHSKFADAFQAISGIKQKYNGGAVGKFDVGGSVGPWNTSVSSFSPTSTMGDDVVDQAKSNQFGMDLKGYGDTLSKYGDNADHSKDRSAATQASMGAMSNQAQGLSRFMAQSQPQQIQGFEGGGVADWNPDGPVPFAGPSDGGSLPTFLGGAPTWKSARPAMSPIPAYSPSPAATVDASPEPSSAWGDVWGGLKRSPLVSGNWTEGGGPAARALLAASGQHIGGPMAAQAAEMVKERLAKQQADELHKRALAQMAQSAQHHADDVAYRNKSLAQTSSHQAWIEKHGDQPELVRQLVAAGIDPKSDKGRQILEDSIKGNDPIAQIISDRLRGGARAQPSGVQPQSFEGGADAAPRLQPISDTGEASGRDPNLILAQAAKPGQPQSQEPMVDTPIGKMPMSEAKQVGGLMLSSPKYKAMGEHILKQVDKSDENRVLSTSAKTEVDKALVSGANHLGRLEDIGKDFDPKFLTVPYRAGSAFGAGLEKMGFEMDPETKMERERYSQFRAKTAGNLNALLKELSGSAVTQNEYERMLIQEPNAGTGGMLDIVRGDNPTDFQSKLNSSKAMAKMAIARANWLRTSQNFSSDAVANMAKNGALSTYAPLDNMKKIMDTTQGQIMQNLKVSNPNAPDDQLIPVVRQRMNQIFGI